MATEGAVPQVRTRPLTQFLTKRDVVMLVPARTVTSKLFGETEIPLS
jgi:hypothetical protein